MFVVDIFSSLNTSWLNIVYFFFRISLVNENLLNHFVCDLEVGRHFEVLRRYMLMQDGEFSQSLSDQLFQKVSST